MSTFTWSPTYNTAVSNKPRVKTTKFGDGYQQRIADGINSSPRSYSNTFQKKRTEMDTIEAYLKLQNGVSSFDWTPPYATAGKWICPSWSRVYKDGYDTLTATFEEVYGD